MSKKVEETAKALAVKEQAGAPALIEKFGSLAEMETDISAKDLLLSKILAMQGQSKLVQDEKAKIGDIRDSLTGTLVAAKETPVEVILFNPFKTWVVFKNSASKQEYLRTELLDAKNANYERETKDEIRFETLNYYTLLVSEIVKGQYIPKVISLRSTNYITGKKIESKRAFLKKFGKALPFQVFNLSTVKRQNDKGSWYMFDVTDARDSTDAELTAVKDWMSVIANSKVTVDDSDLAQGEATEVEDTGEY